MTLDEADAVLAKFGFNPDGSKLVQAGVGLVPAYA